MTVNQPSVRPRQAAELLGIGESTLHRWRLERSDFPKARRLSPRTTVFDTAELIAWRDAQPASTSASTK